MNEAIESLGSFQPVLEAYATDVAHRRNAHEPLDHGEWTRRPAL